MLQNLPVVIFEAHCAILIALKERCGNAYYLDQLEGQPQCTFVEVLRDKAAVRVRARDLRYGATGSLVHFTETWTRFLLTNSVTAGLKRNERRIFLAGDSLDASAAAHEFIHWLSHPNWGIVFEANLTVNEGVAEALTRNLSGDKYSNGIYDKEVKCRCFDCSHVAALLRTLRRLVEGAKLLLVGSEHSAKVLEARQGSSA
jgi:hypothetical protein